MIFLPIYVLTIFHLIGEMQGWNETEEKGMLLPKKWKKSERT